MNFSVIIPLFNKEKHVERSIRSVLNQTHFKFELLVINDGSTDLSLNVVKNIKDKRIRIISKNNGGVSSARNLGIQQAKNEYIAFLDADDEWNNNFLSTINGLISKYPKAGLYATAYCLKKDNIEYNIKEFQNFPKGWEGILDDYFKYAIKRPIVTSSSVVIRRNVFNKIGLFNVNYRHGEDLDMWTRIALEYDIAYSHNVKSIYYLDTQNKVTNNEIDLLKSRMYELESRINDYRKKPNYSFFTEEYLINGILTKALTLSKRGLKKESKSLIRKYKHTKLNKKLLLKNYLFLYFK